MAVDAATERTNIVVLNELISGSVLVMMSGAVDDLKTTFCEDNESLIIYRKNSFDKS